MNIDNPPKLIHTKHNKVILDEISKNLHNTTRINHLILNVRHLHAQIAFLFGLHLNSIFFHSSLNICLSSDATLPANDQNDVINEMMTIKLASSVLAFTKYAVDNKICGALCIVFICKKCYNFNIVREQDKFTELQKWPPRLVNIVESLMVHPYLIDNLYKCIESLVDQIIDRI